MKKTTTKKQKQKHGGKCEHDSVTFVKKKNKKQ